MLGLTFYSCVDNTCIAASCHAKGRGRPKNYLYTTVVYKNMTSYQKTSLTPQRFIEVPVSNQESYQSCIFVLGVPILLLSMIFQ